MKKLLKPFFLASFAVSVVGTILVSIGYLEIFYAVIQGAGSARAPRVPSQPPSAGILLLIGVGSLALIYATVVMLILFYRMWASIQDGHARTSPGKAVGFLFIPLFNLYWMFQVLWGFSKDYNSYVERNALRVPKLPEGLFLLYNILYFAIWVPILGFVAYWVVSFIIISRICDAVNALPDGTPATVNVGQLGSVAEGIRLPGMLSLYCVSGEFAHDAMEIPVDGIYIGRDPAKVNLVLGSDEISGVHVRVWPEPNSAQVWVEDWNSLNGTFYCQPGAGGGSTPEWIPLQGKVLLGNGARFRLGTGVAEFEIRTA